MDKYKRYREKNKEYRNAQKRLKYKLDTHKINEKDYIVALEDLKRLHNKL